MPVEIRELVIRMVGEVHTESEEEKTEGELSEEARRQIIEECVREVVRILERARER